MGSNVQLLLLVLISSTFLSLGASFNCYECIRDTFGNMTECVGQNTSCLPDEKFCVVMESTTVEDNYLKYEFQRSCGNEEICGGKDYCNFMIKNLNKKSCRFSCCDKELCNTYSLSSECRNLPWGSLLTLSYIITQFFTRQ